ncbi:MAG: VOC family protein [Bacteroidota bacterium]
MKTTLLPSIFLSLLAVACCLTACAPQGESSSSPEPTPTAEPTPAPSPQAYVSLIEIPMTDTKRAIQFYRKLLNIKIEKYDMPDMTIAVLPYENQMVNIVLVKGADYEPSAKGPIVYLETGDKLDDILLRVEPLKGKILVPKTPHADGNGFFALFLDSEGNRMGLNSTK